MDSDSDKSSSEEELREMLRKDQNIDEKNKKLLNRQLSNTKSEINYVNESLFSRIFFNWSKLAIRISNERVLKTSDVCALTKNQSTRYNIKNLQEKYNKYATQKRKYPLMISIFVVHKALLCYLLFLDVTSMILDYMRMFFFSKILTIFSENNFFPENRTFYDIFIQFKINIVEATGCFMIIKFIRAIMLNHLDFNNIILSEKITNEMSSLLYEKIIKGSTVTNYTSKDEGEKLNLIEEDAEEIGSLFFLGPFVFTAPVKIGISVYFLFKLLGPRFFYAIIALILLVFLILILQIVYVKNLKILLKYKNIYQQYIFHQIVGKGKNCVVFSGYDLVNKRDVAIKKINKSFLTLEDLSLIQTEVDTLKVCQHPYVVKLYEIIETYSEVNIVLEYCEQGNLYFYLSKNNFVLSEEEIATYIHNISKAVYSIHNLGIIHRDLKLSNIALTKKNNKVEIRILDFGLSKILGPNQLCNEGYGTPGYAAPEVINRYNYSFEADIWSIGVICYFLCMRKLPFDYIRAGNNEMDMIENTLLDEVKFDYNIMKKYSKYAEKFIRDLMNKNTFERPTITEVLEHPWLQLFFGKEVKNRIVNTYKKEFYTNPDIDDLYTCDDNIENDNSKDIRANYLLYTNVNNK